MEGWSTRSTDTFPRYSDLRCRFDPVLRRPVLQRDAARSAAWVLGQRLRPPDDAGDGRRAGPDAAGARRAAQHHAAHGAPRRRARLRLHRGRRRAAHRRAARRPEEVYGLHPLVRARRARHVEPDTLRAPVLVAP
jgi:hypothetical protein